MTRARDKRQLIYKRSQRRGQQTCIEDVIEPDVIITLSDLEVHDLKKLLGRYATNKKDYDSLEKDIRVGYVYRFTQSMLDNIRKARKASGQSCIYTTHIPTKEEEVEFQNEIRREAAQHSPITTDFYKKFSDVQARERRRQEDILRNAEEEYARYNEYYATPTEARTSQVFPEQAKKLHEDFVNLHRELFPEEGEPVVELEQEGEPVVELAQEEPIQPILRIFYGIPESGIFYDVVESILIHNGLYTPLGRKLSNIIKTTKLEYHKYDFEPTAKRTMTRNIIANETADIILAQLLKQEDIPEDLQNFISQTYETIHSFVAKKLKDIYSEVESIIL